MKDLYNQFYYSFPVQLFILHFKKYQVLLFVWYMVFSIINGGLLHDYGAEALFFLPEYNGETNMTALILVGVSWGMFIICWNITTFILHSGRFKFLSATRHPFLKYCINNSLLPIIFFLFYFVRLYNFVSDEELKSVTNIYADLAGILVGFFLLMGVSFVFFFTAGKTISLSMPMTEKLSTVDASTQEELKSRYRYELKVKTFISDKLKLASVDTSKYIKTSYAEGVFRRHRLATFTVLLFGFIFLAFLGFFLDNPAIELPAAASMVVFFSILIALVGALSYFLQSWSLPFAIILLFLVNYLFEKDIIDPRNKAFGLNYINVADRPMYNKASLNGLCTPDKILADKENMIEILNNWKARQNTDKPLMVFINVSGGGLRSAAFTMNSLQKLDSLTKGELMKHTFLMSGASGGMLASTYYRELYRSLPPGITPSPFSEKKYADDVTSDMLNTVFTSLVTRDLLGNRQKFKVGKFSYIKDRGYAFEKKLGDNTHGLLNASLQDVIADEHAARVPLVFFNAVINSDARKMVISSQPVSFMMKSTDKMYDMNASPDAVDFCALFRKQNPMKMRLVTALRMNASFPYILPNVWLPSQPVIDVMDAGLRDNYGQETTLRFIDHFKPWIKENTSGVLIIQLRDSPVDDWNEAVVTKNISDMLVTPATMLQQNWNKLQQYFLSDQYGYLKSNASFILNKAEITYIASNKDKTAAMSLHLTANEKKDVTSSFYNPLNRPAIDTIVGKLKSNRLQ